MTNGAYEVTTAVDPGTATRTLTPKYSRQSLRTNGGDTYLRRMYFRGFFILLIILLITGVVHSLVILQIKDRG